MRVRVIWPPVLLMTGVGALAGFVWGLWSALLIAPLSIAVGWAVGRQEGRREP